MHKTLTSLAATAALALIAGAAPTQTQAQTRNCGDHAQVVERLASGYGESRQSIGMGADNTVVEVFASLETGTWTITVTAPGGPTCLVASGQAYQNLYEDLPNTDQGA
ncbi:hypothetical protein [Pseudooctadecabacter jejudonensis]|uniref:PepSY domain-containing protein n=1 Tax=Pseudooctadecabacter jejudonensis TaxID=1391910 RepID=A0A1Y5RVK1_9RHOB|nr:hypothetical protein [Pseudooctadecabacter jejudonensis]SLN26493.1 hypothetical protein PSJ8397_01064 [Pseudooctadecabacter jejudonensis]